mgnify:CR=1 FL=1
MRVLPGGHRPPLEDLAAGPGPSCNFLGGLQARALGPGRLGERLLPGAGGAWGVALEEVVDEAGGESLNFRQGDLAFESDFKALRDRAGFLIVIAFLLISGFFGRQVLELQALEAHHGQLTAALEEFSESVLGEKRDSFDFVKKRLLKPVAKDEDPIFPEAAFTVPWKSLPPNTVKFCAPVSSVRL